LRCTGKSIGRRVNSGVLTWPGNTRRKRYLILDKKKGGAGSLRKCSKEEQPRFSTEKKDPAREGTSAGSPQDREKSKRTGSVEKGRMRVKGALLGGQPPSSGEKNHSSLKKDGGLNVDRNVTRTTEKRSQGGLKRNLFPHHIEATCSAGRVAMNHALVRVEAHAS